MGWGDGGGRGPPASSHRRQCRAARPGSTTPSGRFFLGYDLLQLAVAASILTGGCTTLRHLILAPVTVSSTVLSRRSTTGLALLAWRRSRCWR